MRNVHFPESSHQANERKVHWVYRCFDAEGRLIYVGCTLNLIGRLNAHKSAWWADQVVKVKAKIYPNRTLGRTMEKRAIRNEHPRWNCGGRNPMADWPEHVFKDFVYAYLRSPDWNGKTRSLTHPRVVELIDLFETLYGHPLTDSRHDEFQQDAA